VTASSTANAWIRRNRAASGELAARSAAYALWSRIVASPRERADDEPSLVEYLSELIAVAAHLPYEVRLAPLSEPLWRERLPDDEVLAREYSALFEIGSEGPPIAIREEHAPGRPAGSKERIARFFDYFGYELDPGRAWAMDHIAVLLEFQHFLCYREWEDEPDYVAASQRAQRDFTGAHIAEWLPVVTAALDERPGPYAEIFRVLERFVGADLAWQRLTLERLGEG
jgi:DMSO reductase family type II enzyme chaperone